MAPSQYLVFGYVYVLLCYMAITACLFNLMNAIFVNRPVHLFMSEKFSSPLPMGYYLFLIMTYHLIALVEASSCGMQAEMHSWHTLVEWFILYYGDSTSIKNYYRNPNIGKAASL